mmetsp:Transcript_5857/g.7661  ORF Transcript_5857/g.7661 Transcript_5857/m.7661 type:complete len:117 (+) Transcript_5857:1080-1430(+)
MKSSRAVHLRTRNQLAVPGPMMLSELFNIADNFKNPIVRLLTKQPAGCSVKRRSIVEAKKSCDALMKKERLSGFLAPMELIPVWTVSNAELAYILRTGGWNCVASMRIALLQALCP